MLRGRIIMAELVSAILDFRPQASWISEVFVREHESSAGVILRRRAILTNKTQSVCMEYARLDY